MAARAHRLELELYLIRIRILKSSVLASCSIHTMHTDFVFILGMFAVSPESVVIPIVSCIFGFPLLALLVICCLRRRAKLARERDRRRNFDLQDHAVSLVRFSPIHRLSESANSGRSDIITPNRFYYGKIEWQFVTARLDGLGFVLINKLFLALFVVIYCDATTYYIPVHFLQFYVFPNCCQPEPSY